MKSQDLVLIPTTVYGTPSGNYDGSSAEFSGDRQQAANYYRRTSSTQTVSFITTDLVARIKIQGTLDTSPTEDYQWVDLLTVGSASTPASLYSSAAITGNFTWLRAKVVDFTSGTINEVALTY